MRPFSYLRPCMAKPLNFPLFISRRIRAHAPGRFSSTIQRIAVGSIAVSVGVILVSVFILRGFRSTIENKIFSLAAHILVTQYANTNSYDENPISINNDLYLNPENFDGVAQVHPFSNKAGLLKTDEEVQGVFLKGVNSAFDTAAFAQNMVNGRFLHWQPEGPSLEIVISEKLAKLLRISVEDRVALYFVQNPPRVRRVTVVGIYNTYLEDFDDRLILGDLAMIQQLNGWSDTLVGGFEVHLNDFDRLDEGIESVLAKTETNLSVRRVTDRYPQLFDWLDLVDTNEKLVSWIVLIVVGLNMVSILLILIMERTGMIGLLKALGSSSYEIGSIFLYNAQWLILRGLLWGNVLGLGFAALQYYFRIIPLDPENYYMPYVPIQWEWWALIKINLGVIAIVNVVLLIPVLIVNRIHPVRSLRFH